MLFAYLFSEFRIEPGNIGLNGLTSQWDPGLETKVFVDRQRIKNMFQSGNGTSVLRERLVSLVRYYGSTKNGYEIIAAMTDAYGIQCSLAFPIGKNVLKSLALCHSRIPEIWDSGRSARLLMM